MINPQAFIYLWLVVLLISAVSSAILLFHWWQYLETKKLFVTISFVYLFGLGFIFITSTFALYALIS